MKSIDLDLIREQARIAVDPLFLKFRSELYGSGVSFGRIRQDKLPTTTIYTTNLDSNVSNLGYIRGITTRENSATRGTNQTILNFINASVTSAGNETTITIPSGYSDPLTTDGDILRRASGQTQRLPIGTQGQFLRVNNGLPEWQTFSALSDPTTTSGDIIVRGPSDLQRLGIGSDDFVLSVVSGNIQWRQLPHNTLSDVLGDGDRHVSSAQLFLIQTLASSAQNIDRVLFVNPVDSIGTDSSFLFNTTSGLLVGSTRIDIHANDAIILNRNNSNISVRLNQTGPNHIDINSPGTTRVLVNSNQRFSVSDTTTSTFETNLVLNNAQDLQILNPAPSGGDFLIIRSSAGYEIKTTTSGKTLRLDTNNASLILARNNENVISLNSNYAVFYKHVSLQEKVFEIWNPVASGGDFRLYNSSGGYTIEARSSGKNISLDTNNGNLYFNLSGTNYLHVANGVGNIFNQNVILNQRSVTFWGPSGHDFKISADNNGYHMQNFGSSKNIYIVPNNGSIVFARLNDYFTALFVNTQNGGVYHRDNYKFYDGDWRGPCRQIFPSESYVGTFSLSTNQILTYNVVTSFGFLNNVYGAFFICTVERTSSGTTRVLIRNGANDYTYADITVRSDENWLNTSFILVFNGSNSLRLSCLAGSCNVFLRRMFYLI